MTQFNIKEIKNWAIVIGIVILLVSFFWIQNNKNPVTVLAPLKEESIISTESLVTRTNDAGDLSIEVKPVDFSFDKPIQFKISFNTHEGDLDFDLTQKSVLIDDKNNQYLPVEWQGGTGGHHISGTLIFPLIKETKEIKLIIKDIYGVEKREFLWELE